VDVRGQFYEFLKFAQARLERTCISSRESQLQTSQAQMISRQ
jgi:hypothetical protein